MFTHPLAQNDEQHGGYTVFTFDFAGTKIKFMTFADVKILEARARKETLEEAKAKIPKHPKVNGYDIHAWLDEEIAELEV